MISLVSNHVSAVIPFVTLRENKPCDGGLSKAMEQIDRVHDTRFFPHEGAGHIRMATVLSAAILSLDDDDEAVVVLAPEGGELESDPAKQAALKTAIDVARTGKNVQIVHPRSEAVSQDAVEQREIQGVRRAFFVDPKSETGMEGYDPSGILVLRADRFLIEAAILCPSLYRMVAESLATGFSQALPSDQDLVALGQQSFKDAFWCKTENRALVVVSDLEVRDVPALADTSEVEFEPLVLVGANKQ